MAKLLQSHQVMDKNKIVTKIVWGGVLTLAGIGVFFRIPQVMPKIAKIEYFASFMYYIRFCFYLLGVLLIWSGAKRIFENYRKLKDK